MLLLFYLVLCKSLSQQKSSKQKNKRQFFGVFDLRGLRCILMYYLLQDVNCCLAEQITHFLAKSLIMENLLLEAITHVKNISKKSPTVKRLLAYIKGLGVNNSDESVVGETLCILRTKGIINQNYKILMTNDTNTLPSDDELLETPLISSADDTPPDPNLLLFQELPFSVSNSTAPTIHSAVISGTSTSNSKKKTLFITTMI